jgi:hypothetical protein
VIGRASRRQPGPDHRATCAASPCCTTPRHKAHGTTPSEEAEVAYAWHPWFGRTVLVREALKRTSGAVVRCRPQGAEAVLIQDVPVWMLDADFCRSMRTSPRPVATVSALLALQSLLSTSAESALESDIGSPDSHHGKRHGSQPPPGFAAGSSAGPVSTDPFATGDIAAKLGRPSSAGPERGGQLDRPDASRPRGRRGRVKGLS